MPVVASLGVPYTVTMTKLVDRLIHYSIVVVTGGESFRMREARGRRRRPQAQLGPNTRRGGDFYLATSVEPDRLLTGRRTVIDHGVEFIHGRGWVVHCGSHRLAVDDMSGPRLTHQKAAASKEGRCTRLAPV